jgi:dTDP-4-dehydrorhamnose reductase
MKIVLFGKNGQLGWEFQRILPSFGEVISLGREDLDISDISAVKNILNKLEPNLIINASAYTEVDTAEIEPDKAMLVNAIAPGVMAEIARKLGAVFIHYSTDYVFDGQGNTPYLENDKTNPLNMYGKSKLAGEENITQAGGAYLILRTSWVYSMRGNSFVNKVLSWARKNETLKIVNDQVSNPTWARELAQATSLIFSRNNENLFESIKGKRGIYHLAGRGYTSRYEWAKHILANDPNREEQVVKIVEPVSSEEFPTPAIRPLFSALDCSKFEETFKISLPYWKESLHATMAPPRQATAVVQ